MFSTKK